MPAHGLWALVGQLGSNKNYNRSDRDVIGPRVCDQGKPIGWTCTSAPGRIRMALTLNVDEI